MKTHIKYIGPLILCGLIIFIFSHIRRHAIPVINLHPGKAIQMLMAKNAGAAKYLFYRHMYVNIITH